MSVFAAVKPIPHVVGLCSSTVDAFSLYLHRAGARREGLLRAVNVCFNGFRLGVIFGENTLRRPSHLRHLENYSGMQAVRICHDFSARSSE